MFGSQGQVCCKSLQRLSSAGSSPPIQSPNMRKSDTRDHTGYLNVKGLFRSTKKCAVQAKKYPARPSDERENLR